MPRTFLAALFLLTLYSAAWAGPGLAILELRFQKVPAPIEAKVRRRIVESFAASGYDVMEEQRSRSELEHKGATPGCTMGPCLSQVQRLLGPDRVVVGGISGQGTSYDISLTLLECGGGTVIAQITQRCDVCTFKEIEDRAAATASGLHKKALVFLASQATLVVRSAPDHATILLDGSPAGQTPLRRVLPPGPHTVEAAAADHSPAKHRLRLEAGRTTTLRVALAPRVAMVSATPARPKSGTTPRWVKWVVLGAGAVAGGLGGGLLALDGRKTSDPRYLHDTRAAGVTLVSAGAAAAIAASLMVLVESPSRDNTVRWAERPDVD